MKKLKLLVVSVLLVAAPACEQIEYDIFGDVCGVVLDSRDGMPLQGVMVFLAPGGMNVVTGADGKFEFNDLESRQYSITVQKEGYETNRMTVNVVVSETSNVTLTMNIRE